jgi:hypothetical protein
MVNCLLIDKKDATRNVVASMLSDLGIQCQAHDLWPPSKPLPRNRFDLILIGNAAGDDLAHLYSKNRQPLVFHYFASHPDIDVIGKLIVHGVADILVMPFDSHILGFKLTQAGLRIRQAAA